MPRDDPVAEQLDVGAQWFAAWVSAPPGDTIEGRDENTAVASPRLVIDGEAGVLAVMAYMQNADGMNALAIVRDAVSAHFGSRDALLRLRRAARPTSERPSGRPMRQVARRRRSRERRSRRRVTRAGPATARPRRGSFAQVLPPADGAA